MVVAALSAVALFLANAVGLLLLRSNLTDRIDEQLTGMSRSYSLGPPLMLEQSGIRSRAFPRGDLGPAQVLQLIAVDGSVEQTRASDDGVSLPDLGDIDLLNRYAETRQSFTVDSLDASGSWRVVVVPRTNSAGFAAFAVSMRDVDATADTLLAIDVAVVALVLLLLAAVAASVVRIGLRPLTRMERISAEITGGDLSRRVGDLDPHTEFGRLGMALNSMLDRIESEVAARTNSEHRLRQFVADASHELRTPLTSIRGFAELYRRGGAPPGAALDETMSRIEAEAARMGLLVEDLLLLARLDRRRLPLMRPVDLLEIAADTIRDAHARVPDRPVLLDALEGSSAETASFEPVTVLGDEHSLRQVATNLVANALQHTPTGAAITVRVGRLDRSWHVRGPVVAAVGRDVSRTQQIAVLEVADTGPGIPPEHAGRVFERLYRLDPSRNRVSGGGSGLGLSIVAAIVDEHGGRVELVTASGRGAQFRVLLPVAPAGPSGHGQQKPSDGRDAQPARR